jgi:hypothetical protein
LQSRVRSREDKNASGAEYAGGKLFMRNHLRIQSLAANLRFIHMGSGADPPNFTSAAVTVAKVPEAAATAAEYDDDDDNYPPAIAVVAKKHGNSLHNRYCEVLRKSADTFGKLRDSYRLTSASYYVEFRESVTAPAPSRKAWRFFC